MDRGNQDLGFRGKVWEIGNQEQGFRGKVWERGHEEQGNGGKFETEENGTGIWRSGLGKTDMRKVIGKNTQGTGMLREGKE